MTNEDQDAIVGRTVRQLRDVKEKLAKLKSKAHLLGDAFNTVSYHFQNKPELLRFEREDTDTRFIERREDWNAHRGNSEPHIPSKDDLDISKVIAIRDEIRVCLL
jgi:hypothetical protein